MSNAILPHTLAVFAVGGTPVYCYDLRPVLYDTKQYQVLRKGRMKCDEVPPPVSYVVTYIPCSKIENMVWAGLYCSMGRSRIIRVGTRIYVIRIAAVSQEHVHACITRKITRAENDMVLMLTSKLIWVCGWSK